MFYDNELRLVYTGLDPNAQYTFEVVYKVAAFACTQIHLDRHTRRQIYTYTQTDIHVDRQTHTLRQTHT